MNKGIPCRKMSGECFGICNRVGKANLAARIQVRLVQVSFINLRQYCDSTALNLRLESHGLGRREQLVTAV